MKTVDRETPATFAADPRCGIGVPRIPIIDR